MPALRPYDPVRRVEILGDMWKATKNGNVLSCEVRTSPSGWELRCLIQFQIQRAQVCKTEDETTSTAEAWRSEAVSRGWELSSVTG